MPDEFKEKLIDRALEELVEHARSLAYFDERRSVAGEDDVFRKMHTVTQMLSGLKQAVKRYDETLQYFEEEAE